MGLNIVIVQNHRPALDGLKEELEGSSHLSVTYLTNPVQALAASKDAHVLVSGQMFYDPATNLVAFVALHSGAPLEIPKKLVQDDARRLEHITSGNILVQRALTSNPALLTIEYSSDPDGARYFCGRVDKDPKYLSDLLRAPDFLDACMTRESGRLPVMDKVKWYFQNFKGWT